jgi:cytochrome c556
MKDKYMINKFPFSWEDIHTHFPKENVASIRKNLMEEYRSGKYSDSELMGRYHMSKDAFYNSVEKYKDAVELADFMDESKAPKNPHRTILSEHEGIVKEIIKEDREELKKKQAKFEADMEVSGKNLKLEKLKRLKKEMRRSLKGCRKIACDFNTEMSMNGEEIRISKSKINDNGKEFKNNRVADYCSQNSITLNFSNSGSPWENGFVERDMRTLKEECLNLIWINNINEIQPILDNYKQEYNFRPNMAFGYKSPYGKKAEYLWKKISPENNLLSWWGAIDVTAV